MKKSLDLSVELPELCQEMEPHEEKKVKTFLFLFEFFWIDCNTFEPCMERVVETLIVNFSSIPIHIWLNQSDDENWDLLERRFPAFPFYPQYNDSSSCWAFWFFFHIISYISVKRVKLCHHVNPMWESFFFNLWEKERESSTGRWNHFSKFIMILWLFLYISYNFISPAFHQWHCILTQPAAPLFVCRETRKEKKKTPGFYKIIIFTPFLNSSGIFTGSKPTKCKPHCFECSCQDKATSLSVPEN